MKKLNISLLISALIILISCSKEAKFQRKIDGTWQSETKSNEYEVYSFDKDGSYTQQTFYINSVQESTSKETNKYSIDKDILILNQGTWKSKYFIKDISKKTMKWQEVENNLQVFTNLNRVK